MIAESIFWVRDDGAFPHLNIYVADADLGVRLMPGATQRVRYGGNPTTHVRINAQGFRGADWPDRVDNAIAVLGDSQAFGLGVEETETFAARLGELTNRPILNAGVPTLGPPELLEVARDLAATRKPRTMVLAINMVNDLFELTRRNNQRHAVWDGWAVRIETAPEHVMAIPGRTWLMRNSHLVYALRRLAYESRAARVGALPSEGAWRELVPQSQADLTAANDRDYRAQLRAADDADAALVGALSQRFARTQDFDENIAIEAKLIAARGNPGDIVAPRFAAESARPVDFTAVQLMRHARSAGRIALLSITPEVVRESVEYREALRRQIPDDDANLRRLSQSQQAAMQRLSALRASPIAFARVASPLNATLESFAAICQPPACDPVVVVLPLDLQVAEEEWRKYDLTPYDVSAIDALGQSVVRSAAHLGMRTLDALPVLKAASPGAFLAADIHMTPRGHEAVARAIADVLSTPAPLAPTSGVLPEGRTRVPSAEEFRRTGEIIVPGSAKAGCETVQVDEWLRIQCRTDNTNQPRHITLVAGSRDAFINRNARTMTAVVPVVAGASAVVLDLVWKDRTQRLTAERQTDGAIKATLSAPVPGNHGPEPASPGDERLCACAMRVYGVSDCADVYGSLADECFAGVAITDEAACAAALECAQGMPGQLATCAPGFANAGGTLQCTQLCSPEVSCARGACVPWPSTHVCLGGP